MNETPEIPEEAVDAALDVAMDDGHNGIDCRPERHLEDTMRAALAAALPHLQPQQVDEREVRHCSTPSNHGPHGWVLGSVDFWCSGLGWFAEETLADKREVAAERALLDEAEQKALAATTFELGRALGRKEAAEEIAVAIEGEPSERKCAQIARNITSQPSQAVSNGLTAPSGHTDLPQAPQTTTQACPEYYPVAITPMWCTKPAGHEDRHVTDKGVTWRNRSASPDLPEGA